ncbi:MAG: alpha/beta fold hydrolase [Polyangiales bacterium]
MNDVRMGRAKRDNVELYFEDHGDKDGDVILLVAGLSVQLLFWPDSLVKRLVDEGYRVVRFDNRDVGFSTRLKPKRRPWITTALARYRIGRPIKSDYDLHDLTDDALSVLDELNIESAHWVGVSMGGMITQLAASKFPNRVKTVTLLMSSSMDRDLPGPRWDITKTFLKPPMGFSQDAFARSLAESLEVIASPGFAPSPDDQLRYAQREVARGGLNPNAPFQHLRAIFATGSLVAYANAIKQRTLIVHGAADNLLPVEASYRLKKHIAHADLQIIDGMSHDLPEGLVQTLGDRIVEHLDGETVASTNVKSLPNQDLDVLVIGAGFSGIAAAIRLKQEGYTKFRVLERANEIGGTWRDNTYPGCACDVQSHLYSISFEPNAEWSRKYSGWREIEDYLLGCVEKHELRKFIDFNTDMSEARFDEASARWIVRSKNGKTYRSKALIAAVGPLANPSYPKIDGMDRFKGASMHSARWDHDYDFSNKRVAVIGTGASAIQFVPELAKVAAELTVFQRTPPWILPKPDRAFMEIEKSLFRNVDAWREFYRGIIYARNELTLASFLREHSWMRSFAQRLCEQHIARHVPDESLRQKLTPDYRLGCKRVLISNNYYPAIAQDNVFLQTDDVVNITEHAVVTADGTEHSVDAIVYGTGFLVSKPLHTVRIAGKNGVDLATHWEENHFATYLGTTVSGFPNAFVLAGPNTGIGHTSLIYMIESQLNHVMSAIGTLVHGRVAYLDVKVEKQNEFVETVRERTTGSVWASGCESWYLSDQGENFSIWPDYTFKFRQMTRTLNLGDYHVVFERPASVLRRSAADAA